MRRYESRSEDWRLVTAPSGDGKAQHCDRAADDPSLPAPLGVIPAALENRWYRFGDGDGAHPRGRGLSTTPPSANHCGTTIPGWLSALPPSTLTGKTDASGKTDDTLWPFNAAGSVPSPDEGVVERVVCFDYNQGGGQSLSCYRAVVISVVNCRGYTLWRLPDVPSCAYPTAYCLAAE
jgi:hypothetical protein